MPRLKSPPMAKRSSNDDDDDDEDDYGEESFESFSSPTGKTITKSDEGNRKSATPEEDAGDKGTEDANKSQALNEVNSVKSLEGAESGLQGMDLETFMQKVVKKGGDEGLASNANDPSMRPLEGVSPNQNPADLALGIRLGYTEEDEVDCRDGVGGEVDDRAAIKNENSSSSSSNGNSRSGVVSSSGNDEKVKVKKRATFRFEGDEEGEYHDDDDDDNNDDSGLGRNAGGGSKRGVQFGAGSKATTRQLPGKASLQTNKTNKTKGPMSKPAPARTVVIQKPVQVAKGPISPEQYAYYASLLSRKAGDEDDEDKAEEPMKRGQDGMPSDEDSARRVDALLSELLPHRANKATLALSQAQAQTQPSFKQQPQSARRGKVAAASSSSSSSSSSFDYSQAQQQQQQQQQYGLGVPRADADEFGRGAGGDARYSQALEAQVGTLKKDLRARDDRLQRLTEHSMLLSNHCDNLKAELSQMQQKLRAAELDLEAKEQRAADAARLRKKAVKRSQRLALEMENYEALAETCERLQTRETALLEAVEALSTQNEDLIKKLKASMARELELSQRHAKQAASHLEDPSSPGEPRAQSDTRLQRYKSGRRITGGDLGGGGGSSRLPDVGRRGY